MRMIKGLVVLFLIVAAGLSAVPAHADPKPWIWSWGPYHFDDLDFMPYLEDSTHPQNGQWKNSNWKPEDWIAQRKSEKALIDGFYRADIIRKQYVHDRTPILVVGPSFYMLGDEDKIRVTKSIDHIWRVTSSTPNGMFMLYDWSSDEPIGAYTKYGLQLQ